MAKKPDRAEPNNDGVDMDRIKAMMGPLPFESTYDKDATNKPPAESVKIIPTTAPIVTKSSKAINDAAEEVNAQLKAMSSTIPDNPTHEFEDRTDVSSEQNIAYLGALDGKPDTSTQPVAGDGVVSDDPTLVSAVNDIVAHESDALLEAEDEKRESEYEAVKPQVGLGTRIKLAWAKPAVRWATLTIVALAILSILVVPSSRYFVLNTAGARASIGVTVIDSSTLQPLKNVTVAVGNSSALTDSKGIAKLQKIKLGNNKLTITKRAFAPITKDVVVGWGSNPQGEMRLAASGAQYGFIVTDFLSGKAIEKVEISSGEGNAVSDKDGKVVLTLDTSGKSDAEELVILIASPDYRTETATITAGNKEVKSVKMVPSRKDVFVSKRSGTYDVYTIDIDAKNEKKIVTGTGIEREDITLLPMQNSDTAAYVATRENVKNSDGYLLSTLYLIDTKAGSIAKVDQSEQILVIGWSSEGRLIYAKIAAGSSAANSKRHRLISLNSKIVTDTKELASANLFNDIVMAGDKVMYAPSNALQDSPKPGLFIVNADGTSAATIIDKEISNIFRTDYDNIIANGVGTKYSYKIGSAPSTVTTTTSASTVNRMYIDNFIGSKSIWVDKRDGKGALVAYDRTAKKDTVLVSKSGLQLPVFWLNSSTVVFRVNDGKETANYVISSNGGEAKKVQDVTNTSGFGRWYYY